MRTRTRIWLMVACFGWPLWAEAAEPSRKPAVAIFINMNKPIPIIQHLRAKGWQTRFVRWGEALTPESLRPFNVIMLPEYPRVDPEAPRNSNLSVRPDYEQHVRTLVWDFVDQGGGVLSYGGDWPIHRKAVNKLLARWGIEFLNEQVIDPAHAFRQRAGMQWQYFYTDRFAKHPITAGVRTIFYPKRMVYGPANYALKYGDGWQDLVRGMREAKSHPLMARQQHRVPDEGRPGTYASSPPLAATRAVGKGRVVVFGWSAVHTLLNYKHYMVENVHFTRGGAGRPSDGLRLLEQTLAYLAEPSLSNPASPLGGYTNKPVRKRVTFPKPIDWTKATIGSREGGRARWHKGILGARTALGGGHGTVAEYAAAARRAGLDFIGFMEDFSKLTPDKWDALRRQCQAATTPRLLVLPGLAVQRGEAGDWYFKISDHPWPQRDMLTPDGKRLNNFLYDYFHTGINTVGPFDIRNQPSPHWVSRAYNSMAVVTTRNGKTDVDLEPYLYNISIQDNPKPVAIDLVTSPDQVAAAAKRFVNLRLCRDQQTLRRSFKRPDDPAFHAPAQVSNGPVIWTWQGLNQWPLTWGRYVAGIERSMTRLTAKSDQTLREAAVYDGTRLLRRYRLEGKTCDLMVHALHARQRELTVVVRDTTGRMAVRSGAGSCNLQNRRYMCGDRQNSLSGMTRVLRRQGHEVWVAANFMMSKFVFRPTGFPAGASTVSRVPWYWDGCPGGYVQGGVEPLVYLPRGRSPQPKNTRQFVVSRMEFPLGSPDVICQAIGTEYVMPAKPYHYLGYWPMQPLETYRADTRFYEFRKRPDGPSAMLVEGHYEMLKDGQWKPHEWHWQRMSHIFYHVYGRPDEACNWAWVNPGKEYLSGSAPPKDRSASFVKVLDPTGYVAYTTHGECGAVFPLDRPFTVAQELNRDGWFRAWIGYGDIGKRYRKGDRIPYRFVVFRGSVTSPADTREVERFRHAFGLGDAARPAYRVTPRAGRVRSTRYVLELEAQDGRFEGVVDKASLPLPLPIRLHGVNPNWTCALVDRRKKGWRPLAVLDGAAYTVVEPRVDRDIWVGNVVVCDHPKLVLTLLPDGKGRFAVEAHNPTDRAIATTIKTAPGLTLTPGAWSAPVTVAPGTSVMLPVK